MTIAVSSAFTKYVFVVLLSTLHNFFSRRQMITEVFVIRKGEWSSFMKGNSFFLMERQTLVDQGFLIAEASRSHSDTQQSVGLLWTSDQPNAENSL